MKIFCALILVLAAALPAAAQDVETHVTVGGGPMSLDDARMNFPTVVESFIAARTRDGYWPLKDKASGTVRMLKLVNKDVKGVQPVEGGEGLFSGRVSLEDGNTHEKLKADFVVDFSGTEWAVKKMRLIPPPKPKKKPVEAKPAPAAATATPPSAPPALPAAQIGGQGQSAAPAPPGPGPAGTPNK